MFDADERRAGALILKELALFNKAAVFFDEQIDPTIRTEIGDLVSDWLKKHDWNGKSNVSEYLEEMWVWPDSWEEEPGNPYAKFNFGYQAGVDTNSYEIADLFGVGQSCFGFRFEPNYYWFGGKAGWNTFAKGIGDLVHEIGRNGWVHDGKGIFFRPVVLPAKLLVPSWESKDWSDALAPLEQALNALKGDQGLFETIIMRANPKGQ